MNNFDNFYFWQQTQQKFISIEFLEPQQKDDILNSNYYKELSTRNNLTENLYFIPGLIDGCVRLCEPGYEHIGTLETELNAALAGGITQLACPPDTDPVLDEPSLVELLKFKTQKLNGVKVHVIGALTKGLKGLHLAELDALSEAGCQGFAQMECDITDTRTLYAALQYAKTLDVTLWLCVQDYYLSEKGVVHESSYTTRLGLIGIPRISETVALQRLLTLIESIKTTVHLTSVSTKEGVELIRQAKSKGLNITADVCIHHLHLTDIDIGFYNPQMRFHPPLCEFEDRNALLEGVLDGTIDMIVSDHNPTAEKNVPFAQAQIGASGVETLWSLIWKLYIDHKLNDSQLARLIDSVTTSPAKILKLSQEQQLNHFTVFAPDEYWNVIPENFVSQGKNSPWTGYELPAKIKATIIDGNVKWIFKK